MNTTRRIRVGWYHYGNCWRFRFGKTALGSVTFYRFWRLYLAVEPR